MATASAKYPKSFTLGAVEWKVTEQEHLPSAMGATYSQEAKVALLSSLNPLIKEQTFYHELVHCILYMMGKPTDQHDEAFVDGFATFLHQFEKTKK